MNIIEKFYILFKSDASEVKKGAEEAKKSTDQLDASLKNANKDTEKTGKAFLELVKAASTFLGVAAAVHKVFAGISSANDYALQLGDASRALGVNARDLDAWGNAVKRTGGTVEGFQQSLRGLSQHFGSSAQVALKVLPKLADVFERLGRFRAIQYGKMLGLDESTILLLQTGRRNVEDIIRRQKELGTVTEANVEDARKYRIAQNELDSAFRYLYLTLAHDVIPILTKVYNAVTPFIEYLAEHKNIVIGALIGIGIAAGVMLAPFIVANATIIAIAAGIALLIAAFALVYEDAVAFYNHQKSLIGLILDKYPIVGKVIKAAFEGLKEIIEIAFAPLFLAVKAAEKIAGYLGIGGNKKLTADIGNGKELIGLAGSNYLASQTSNSIFTSKAFDRNSSINTGDIIINTQATDAVGISKTLGKTLNDHFSQTANYFADGVSY